jgi:hypothetical protein
MLKKIILIVFVTSTVFYPQKIEQLDSIFNSYVDIKQHSRTHIHDEEVIKCGFEIVNRVRTNADQFSSSQQQVLSNLFQRTPRQKSITSPSGYFRIHYDVTGTETPRYDPLLSVDENAFLVAIALDSTFNFQVNYLGYLPPPSDNGKDGVEYDVYIENLGSNLYGYTEFEDEITPGSRRYTSFMVINNSYAGFYTQGIDGARVTVAHEFHHAIQGGSYIYRASDSYYYETTSTAMEEFVYDTINDYYAYMPDYFRNSHLALTQQNGYNLAILNIFLENRYDHDLLRRIWELMVNDNALSSINKALLERESSFDLEYNLFGVWTYYTGYRWADGYFNEGMNYPLIRPLQIIDFSPPKYSLNGNSRPTGNNFIFFTNSVDTLVALISNSDINNANTNPSALQPYTYNLYNYNETGSTKLTDDYYMSFQTEKPNLWQTTEILNHLIIKDGIGLPIVADFAFPSPFHYSKDYLTGSYIFIPVAQNKYGTVEFSVYTSGMDRVYWNIEPIRFNRGNLFAVRWNGLNNNNDKLATGVYLYILKSGDEVKKGKLVIFND